MSVKPSAPNIAFLGIGLMGHPMARRLLRAGFAVTVWNRTHTKAEALAPFGATIADTPEAAVFEKDIVITMLESGSIVAQMVEQVFANLAQGSLFIDMSSTGQSEAQDLHAKLSAAGVACVDAPVSGGVIGADAGSLAIMVGGNQADFDRAQPLLLAMGHPTLVGGAGCGQLAKLCNQLIVGCTLNIVAEALLLAQAGGADPVAVRAAIRGGFAESRLLEVHGQRMLERNFMPGGQVRSQAKDLDNVLVAAANAGLKLPVTELVTTHYRQLALTVPTADQSAALLELERQNPQHRLGHGPDRLPS